MGIDKLGPLSTQHKTLHEQYMKNCQKPVLGDTNMDNTGELKPKTSLASATNSKYLLSQASKVICQAKKTPLAQNATIIGRGNTGSFSPKPENKAVEVITKSIAEILNPKENNAKPTDKANQLTNHVKATSSCSVMVPGKRGDASGASSSRKIHDNVTTVTTTQMSKNRPSDIRPNSKNNLPAMGSAAPNFKTVQIKTAKEANLTLCTDRRQSKGFLKTAKQDIACEDSTHDQTEGIRVERLKGKLKEITGIVSQVKKITEKPKITTSFSPELPQKPKEIFRQGKKSLVNPKERLLGVTKHSLLGSHETIAEISKGLSEEFSPIKPGNMGKTMVSNEGEKGILEPMKNTENEPKTIYGKTYNSEVAGIKMKQEMLRMKMDMLKSRLKKVLRNCPKVIDCLKQKLTKIA